MNLRLTAPLSKSNELRPEEQHSDAGERTATERHFSFEGAHTQTSNPGQLQLYRDRRRIRGTDFVSNPPRFLFQRTNRKACAGVTIAEILRDPRFKTAAAFALRYMNKVVYKQF